jgi:hypothetical protein
MSTPTILPDAICRYVGPRRNRRGPGGIRLSPGITATGLTVLMRGAPALSWAFEDSELIPGARRDAEVARGRGVHGVGGRCKQSKAGE